MFKKLVYSTRRFVVCLSVCHFVCFSPFSIAITSLGEERANLCAFRTFVRFVLVWICWFPLPLGVWERLRFVIVALPGLFSYLFFGNPCRMLVAMATKTKTFKNLLVRNHWTDFNLLLQKCSFGGPLPRLFKPSWVVKKHGRQRAGLIFLYIFIENFKKSSCQKPQVPFQYNLAEMFLW